MPSLQRRESFFTKSPSFAPISTTSPVVFAFTATLLSELLVALSLIDGLNMVGVLVLISIDASLLSSTRVGPFSSTNIPESIQKMIGITIYREILTF